VLFISALLAAATCGVTDLLDIGCRGCWALPTLAAVLL